MNQTGLDAKPVLNTSHMKCQQYIEVDGHTLVNLSLTFTGEQALKPIGRFKIK
jgi:hypothetical protein